MIYLIYFSIKFDINTNLEIAFVIQKKIRTLDELQRSATTSKPCLKFGKQVHTLLNYGCEH